MKFFRVRAAIFSLALLCLFALPSRAGQSLLARDVAAEANANSRYVIEKIQITGEAAGLKISRSLQQTFQQLVGSHFDPSQLDELAQTMRKELHLKSVTPHLYRGSQPDLVRVDFEVQRRAVVFDVSLPKFLYHSKQGWSAEGLASTTIARTNRLSFGLVSDGDALTERYAGSAVVYENTHVGADRLHARFEFDDLHEQWNRGTLLALTPGGPEIYRARRVYQPSLAFFLSRGLSLEGGASLQQLDMQNPEMGSFLPRTESANAVFGTFRYSRQFEAPGIGQDLTQAIALDYNIRSSSRAVRSDFSYIRHHWDMSYSVKQGNQTIQDDFTAGYISGDAPLFERFVVGTSSLLRGWNRFEIDPLGGTRLVHNSVTYRYRFPRLTGEVFYDAGSLWNDMNGKNDNNDKGDSGIRHSVGVGVVKSIFTLAVAFPLRDGHMDPVFMVGMNY
jgi:hypothetical protein